ncbi:SDR family NAD(P)-dependent oxidoreductase (plasmid) [Rhodococcus pyridinivorans]|uniref:SDR family NAD(P)-dependent oxidoreductase n=1 Tax=Rhodococcus sp. PAE-6 TaxID=2972477 RepID=UPI000AD135EA|nr:MULTISPECIES: SDR family NAD(P)-dependent oxidoreductase [Rhodococcus]MCT7293654.1 SDR family NAD(P)-dependent oxidoreductase [Rhodococcus sp. PAE-6]UVT27495.1 SDR family NAD(P)-dependent oxidoreductase [Rhodococcus pyridinivorans]WML66342.1 SDR family NAD(P)-dependent oxidoreductase [Rhodococcus sp. AH-ZY2]WML66471.1 SDR family NAD(P)-dependent oxidoreductase [Rhodococcus sp. AH-ZY2]
MVIVTGAGQGLGAAYAERLAAAGAKVVVNDLGVTLDGRPDPDAPAASVVDRITSAGGEAIFSGHDISNWNQAEDLIRLAVDTWGRLDVLVNNAGVLRDRTIAKMTEAEFDAVINVHLKGTFSTLHHAAVHWRERADAGEKVDARVINTTSVSGLFGNVGQANYSAAKAGIAAMTIVASLELARFGVTANCISPGAATRMVASIPGRDPATVNDEMSPRWPAAVVEWLASPRSADVTGRVFLSSGRKVAVAEGWSHGPSAPPADDIDTLDKTLHELLEIARPNADMRGPK